MMDRRPRKSFEDHLEGFNKLVKDIPHRDEMIPEMYKALCQENSLPSEYIKLCGWRLLIAIRLRENIKL